MKMSVLGSNENDDLEGHLILLAFIQEWF